ncbi:MAG: VOC family protein [Halobacteriales archaeon]|nr:VOC family protein [Halobacteriales archaeon]
MALPFGELRYLYVGTEDTKRDLAYYRDVLGAEVVFDLEAFGAKVAAVRLTPQGPLWLLADHREAGSVLPCFAVPDLDKTVKAFRKRGWKEKAGPIEIPDGPCILFEDPSGNELAVYGNVRPDVLLGAGED